MASNNNSDLNGSILSVRGSEGLYLLSPNQFNYSELTKYNNFHDENKSCRINAFDPSGKYFAYCNNSQVKIVDLKNECQVIATIDRPRTSYLKFSPLGTYLLLWETFHISKDETKDQFNLNIYETISGKVYKSILQKKQLEKFVEWSKDESIFAYLVNNEILFFETSQPNAIANKLKVDNITSFSMNPVTKFVAVHSAGKKNEPSFVRLYQYPNVNNVVSNKSFFKADKVEFKWNKYGNNLLLLCSTETSENSYYGDSTLHQMGTNGESQFIELSKKGPIYALEWNPNKDEFIVVYGNMPAKATLFNSRCEAIYDFGTGSRNECFFNPHGNIVCLAGFGNIRGRVEIWNLSAANKVPQEISSFQIDDTTYFEWSPDGEHILTATTAPRLRVSNGFKVWNYNGENKYTYNMPANNELWQVTWQPGAYPQKAVVKKAAAVVKEETKAYVPPHLRGTNKVPDFKSKLHDDDEKPDKNLKIKTKVSSPAEEAEKENEKHKKVEDLKKRLANGEKLEKNQLDKLNGEAELLAELKKLNIN